MGAIPTVATERTPRRAGALALALALQLVAWAAARATPPAISVTYVSAGAVYLDAGRAEGLAIGSLLRVVRGSEKVADLEVDFVAEHSASCKVVTALGEIRKGDRAVVDSTPAADPAAGGETAPAASEPTVEQRAPLPVVGHDSTAYAPKRPALLASGTLAIGARTFSVSGGPSSRESNGRLSLRLSNIAGQPLELRVRTRARRITRDGYGPSVDRTQDSDRLYELSLSWAPERSRFSLQLGRLVGGPFGSLGYTDGALAQFRLTRSFSVGAFGGARADYTDLGFGAEGTRYGGFLRFATPSGPEAGPGFAEVVLGGATETAKGGEESRDYVTVESRFGSGGRWYIFQRAEIDLHRGWRKEVTGDSSQISNAAISASFRISQSLRASLSYDQRRNYLTWETRPRPEEVFTRIFREGGRVALDWQRSSGWYASVGAGVERADDVDGATNSAFLTLMKANAFGSPLTLGGDASFYSGGTADGWVADLRTSWSFRAGHDLGLTLGASSVTMSGDFGGDPRMNEWARLSGTLQLPLRFYVYGEYEYDTGDDLEGDHALVEVGYRF